MFIQPQICSAIAANGRRYVLFACPTIGGLAQFLPYRGATKRAVVTSFSFYTSCYRDYAKTVTSK